MFVYEMVFGIDKQGEKKAKNAKNSIAFANYLYYIYNLYIYKMPVCQEATGQQQNRTEQNDEH